MMNDLLYHAAPAVARELFERLDVALAEMPNDEAERLRRKLVVEEHIRPRMVLTGQYSSGKSTLIKALTNESAQVVIDSAVATDSVDAFDWDGLVDLVDTPGVQAGSDEHDQLAEDALRSADLVLFTVTVDLFDNRLVEHLRHVTEDLHKAPQLLIVLTKCRTMRAAEGVREAAVREALGVFADQVPWVECDAKTYLDGLHEEDPSKAPRRIEASKMTEVTDTINRIARERGDLSKFRVPLQQIALVAGETLGALTDDPAVEGALTVLARQRRALTNRRGLLDSAVGRQATEFRTACIRAADRLADAVEVIEDSSVSDQSGLDMASAALNDELTTANERFVEGVGEVVSSQLADFASEVREIEASPYSRQLAELHVRSEVNASVAPVDVSPGHGRGSDPAQGPAWGSGVADHLNKFQKLWGAGNGVKASSGSKGHEIVYNVGKRVGVKFRPYQAVRWADKIGKAAKVSGAALPVAIELYTVVREDRQEAAALKAKLRRRSALVGQVLKQCDDIIGLMRGQVRRELDSQFGEAVREIDEACASIRDDQALRSELQRAVSGIQTEAEAMLDRLSAPV